MIACRHERARFEAANRLCEPAFRILADAYVASVMTSKSCTTEHQMLCASACERIPRWSSKDSALNCLASTGLDFVCTLGRCRARLG